MLQRRFQPLCMLDAPAFEGKLVMFTKTEWWLWKCRG